MRKLKFKCSPDEKDIKGFKTSIEHDVPDDVDILPEQDARFIAMHLVGDTISPILLELNELGYDVTTLKFSIKAKLK